VKKYLNKIIKHRPIAVLFILFLVSVIIRVPQLNRPLSKHHELNTAAVLTCLQVWQDSGVAYSCGAPIHMFPGAYNITTKNSKYPNLYKRGVYLSMGPFSYILPHFICTTFGVKPSENSIRVFMLFIHFLSGLLIYYLTLTLLKTQLNASTTFNVEANKKWSLVAASLFIFSPIAMWFMGNSYSHETMVFPLYLLALLSGFKILLANYSTSKNFYILYGVSIALSIYTDWLGCVVALVFFTKAILDYKKKKPGLFLITNVLVLLVTIAVILWQYAHVIGNTELKQFVLEQFFNRRLPDNGIAFTTIDFAKYFGSGYGLLAILCTICVLTKSVKWNSTTLIIFLIPFLHYFLFRGFSNEHDYAVLKWAPFVLLTSVLFIKKYMQVLKISTIIVSLLLGIVLYEYVNKPGPKSLNGESYNWMKQIGNTIKKEAAEKEYILINTPSYYYQIGWYAKRNYKIIANEKDAKSWLQTQEFNRAVFFKIDNSNELIQTVRLSK
jgi:hypothetical protein